MPVIVATFAPKEGRFDEVRAVLAAAVPRAHEEAACELYALHRNKDRFVMIEKWADMDALRSWGTSQKVATLRSDLADLVESLDDIVVLMPAPVGQGTKGAL
jgi:quinol monooxygenase YgiN